MPRKAINKTTLINSLKSAVKGVKYNGESAFSVTSVLANKIADTLDADGNLTQDSIMEIYKILMPKVDTPDSSSIEAMRVTTPCDSPVMEFFGRSLMPLMPVEDGLDVLEDSSAWNNVDNYRKMRDLVFDNLHKIALVKVEMPDSTNWHWIGQHVIFSLGKGDKLADSKFGDWIVISTSTSADSDEMEEEETEEGEVLAVS